jgi:hypothetical protein
MPIRQRFQGKELEVTRSRDIVLRGRITSYSVGYLDYTTRVVEVNSSYISQLESEVKPLEKDRLAKSHDLGHIQDYITFGNIHDSLSNKATLLDLLDDSYSE